jgi:hypothetical protein
VQDNDTMQEMPFQFGPHVHQRHLCIST